MSFLRGREAREVVVEVMHGCGYADRTGRQAVLAALQLIDVFVVGVRGTDPVRIRRTDVAGSCLFLPLLRCGRTFLGGVQIRCTDLKARG